MPAKEFCEFQKLGLLWEPKQTKIQKEKESEFQGFLRMLGIYW